MRIRSYLKPSGLAALAALAFSLGAPAQVPTISPAAQAAHSGIAAYNGPATCVTCHEQQAVQMFGSVHYQEMADTPKVPNINGPAGKGANGSMVMNSYCGTPVTSSRATCATCHSGYGRTPSTEMTADQLANIDCLMCHQDAYKRVPAPPYETISFPGTNGLHSIQAPIEDVTGFDYMPDAAKMSISVLEAARTVHKPTRASCLRCHAGAGGSDGGKRGDISTVSVNPPLTSDVHMSPQGANLSCANCHSVGGHRVAGRGVDLRPSDSTNLLSCASCHTARPHGDYSATTSASRDLHAGRVACQTCHISAFAKDKSTEMERSWLHAEFSMAACRGQGGWLPSEVRASNVTPIYRWFDGSSLANVLGQAPIQNAAGEFVLAQPNGSVQSPGAFLFPMKLHLSDAAQHDATGWLIPHSTFSFFTSGDFTKAVQDGQVQSGLEGPATVVNVQEFQTINHGVGAATNALQCGACHSAYTAGGPVRMDLKGQLGYGLKAAQSQLCSQCHSAKSNPGFASVHQKHVSGKRIDCSACHDFSRPERGLTQIRAIRPAAPGGPVAATISDTRLDLVWADHSSSEQGFKIERSADGVSYAQIASVAANVTSASDSSLAPGKSYFYRVRAYNTTGDSDYSQTGRGTTLLASTPEPQPPAAPTGLAVTATSSSQINLSWTDNASNETGFVVERSLDNVSFTQVATLGVNVTTYANAGLTASTTYYYRVRAVNSAGNSAFSNTASATTSGVPPAAPTGLTATAASSSQINLSWTDNASNETGFVIERSLDNVSFTQIATLGANVTTYANAGLTPSTTYYYRVRAVNGAGNSAFSNTASATTSGVPPAAPTGLTATAASSSQINLSWTDNASNETGFVIERSLDNVSFTQIATLGANVTTYANAGLTPSTTYYYRVRAVNGAGNSAFSNTAQATTLAVPPALPAAPTGLSATAASSSQINLSWTDNASNETGFVVERSLDNVSFTQVATLGVNVTTYANAGLTPSTTYYYRVRAVNGAGSSAFSNTASAATTSAGTTTQIVLPSIAAEDGFVLESSENSNVGGSATSGSGAPDALRCGDESKDRQYKTILSFDTSSIPDGATIVSATLRIKRGKISGSSPFETLGACLVDIKSGQGFNGSASLTKEDFQAPADAAAVASLSNASSNGSWSTGTLDARGLSFVNKAGRTQFRIAFQRDDNDDSEKDYVGYYPGEASNASNRPQLEIVYR